MLHKNALSLLVNYGDDSSDDEVPGPRVSTKRTHKSDNEESPEEPIRKKFERLVKLLFIFSLKNSFPDCLFPVFFLMM